MRSAGLVLVLVLVVLLVVLLSLVLLIPMLLLVLLLLIPMLLLLLALGPPRSIRVRIRCAWLGRVLLGAVACGRALVVAASPPAAGRLLCGLSEAKRTWRALHRGRHGRRCRGRRGGGINCRFVTWHTLPDTSMANSGKSCQHLSASGSSAARLVKTCTFSTTAGDGWHHGSTKTKLAFSSMSVAFTLRPLERNPPSTPGNALEAAFRVHLSPKELRNHRLTNGDLIRLNTLAGFKGYGIAWTAAGTNPANKPIAKVTDLLKEQCGLSLNDPVFVEKATDSWKPLASVRISYPDDIEPSAKFSSTQELLYWARYALVDVELVLPGCSLQVQAKGIKEQSRTPKLRLTVQSIDPQPDSKSALYFDPVNTQVVASDEPLPEQTAQSSTAQPVKPVSEVLKLNGQGIGGLSEHIISINKSLSFFSHAALALSDQHLLGPTAFLFHGPEGTGKSMLLERLAESPWKQVHRLSLETHPKNQAAGIEDTFEAAKEDQPSLVLMDNLDKFLEKAETLVGKLRTELAKLEGSKVVVAAAARSIYDIDSSLRTTAGFKTELEIFPPNLMQREDILREILGPTRATSSINFTAVAERAHGFVGRDIHKLCGLARNNRVRTVYDDLAEEEKESFGQVLEASDFVTQADFDMVIDQVQPTVLKDSILEVPKVKWDQIAGLDHVRALLEAITIRPFKVRFPFNIPSFRMLIFTAPRPRYQIRRPSIPQRRTHVRTTRLRQDADRTSRRD